LAEFLVSITVAAFQIFHLTEKRQLFLINYDLIATSTVIIETVVFSSGIGSSFLFLFLDKSLLHTVHLLLSGIDLYGQGLNLILLVFNLITVLQNGSF
jgi:hypothetical protein